jgi:hypothetical protein
MTTRIALNTWLIDPDRLMTALAVRPIMGIMRQTR